MLILRIILLIIIVFFLTMLTQIGGLVLIIFLLIYKKITTPFAQLWKRYTINFLFFLSLYAIATFVIVPPLAKLSGRVPLPLLEYQNVRPANKLTCFLNRNYVKEELKEIILVTAQQINKEYPGTVINYLDASFPFIDNFPLFPLLSHNDGKKLDLSFMYQNALTGAKTNEVPSFTGYGVCEGPKVGEENIPEYCRENNYWQYSLIQKITPQSNKSKYDFDEKGTKRLIQLLVAKRKVGKIFIEPHLKKRMGLNQNKIRFHGCGAVRHDDHIHLEL